jgi:hypothetical protein
MKRAITLVAVVAALLISGSAWALNPSDIIFQGPVLEAIPPEIEMEGGEAMSIENLCSPQVVFSSEKSDYAIIRQCDDEGCIVKLVGKMAADQNFWDHYGKSGDFYAHLFAGTTNLFDEANDLSFHCAPGPAELGQYFLCVAATAAENVPSTPAIRLWLDDPEVCGFSPVKGIKEDANGNNIPDDQEGSDLPVVPVEPLGEDDETPELEQAAPTAPPPFTPPSGGYDEGGGCNAVPGMPANPSAYLIVSLGLAILALRRRR